MRFLGAIWRAVPVRIAFSFSLLLLVALSWGGPLGSLADRMHAAPTDAAAIALAKKDPTVLADPDLSGAVNIASSDNDGAPTKATREHLEQLIRLRALTEGGSSKASTDAAASAKEIKSSVFYKDAGIEQQANWLGRAMDRLSNIHLHLNNETRQTPSFSLFGTWPIYLLWGVLGAAVIGFLYFGLRHVDWKLRQGRKSKAILEEDEPEQTGDEWLRTADELAAKGKYREAVRALYLACLLKFDETKVARFDRRETNWEHLARIRASARRPADLDFTSPTKAFDRIWYGHMTEGLPDVERFRAWYATITEQLRGVGA